MGNCTFTVVKQNVSVDGRRVVTGTLTMSSSYATSGDTLPMTGHGLVRVVGMTVAASNLVGATAPAAGSGGYELRLAGTETVPKVMAYKTTGAEESAATDLSTKSFLVSLHGYA